MFLIKLWVINYNYSHFKDRKLRLRKVKWSTLGQTARFLCLQSHKSSHLTHLGKALNLSAIWSIDHLSIYVFQKHFAAYALCHSYLLSSSLPLSLKRQLMSSSTNSARNKTCLLPPPPTHTQTHTVSRIISEECKSQRKGWHVKKHYLLSKTHPFHSRTLSSYEHLIWCVWSASHCGGAM